MPLGLGIQLACGTVIAGRSRNQAPRTRHLAAGCAAGRSSLRRAGFTLGECRNAYLASRRPGAVAGASFDGPRAAAWLRAQAIALRVAWPGGRVPHGVRLVLASW